MQLEKCYFANNNRGTGAIHAEARPPSNLTVTSCKFTNNGVSYQSSGGAIFFKGGVVSIKDSSFIENGRESVYLDRINSLFVSNTMFNGGTQAVYIKNPGDSVVFLRCNFTRSSGGAVSVRDYTSTNVLFTECNFIDNSASFGGALYIYISTNIPLSLNISFNGCNFTRNRASSSGGALYIASSTNIPLSLNISFNGCNFMRNRASSIGGALYIRTTANIPIWFNKCNFIDNQAISDFRSQASSTDGGAVYISSPSRTTTVRSISLSECNFTNNLAARRGGALFLEVANSLMFITQSYFTDNRLDHNIFPNYGGAVYVYGGDNLISVNGGAFISNKVQQGSGGALFLEGKRTNFSFVDVLFHGNLANSTLESTSKFGHGGAVHISSGDNLISVSGGAFVNNRVVQGGGGALYSKGQRTNFSFVDVLFLNNSATFCGVLEVERLFHEGVNFMHSSFISNRATGRIAPNSTTFYRGGGVICIRNASISIVNSTFNNNLAIGNAGVMHIEGSSVETIDSKFEHNEATLDGGVTYTKLSPNNFAIHRSTFSDNMAGDDGGVMYMGRAGSRVDVNESNFSLNRATDRGGVFVILGSTLNIAESSFNDNTATQGNVINACISKINADNVFETSSSSRTACISYDKHPIPLTEASTEATQTETAITRSIVRRTAAIMMPPQTINPQTTAVTPDYVTEETMTKTPSRVSTTIAPPTDSGASTTSTMAQTDSVSTMGDTSQTEQEPTTNVPTESLLQAEENTTTAAAGISTTSERSTSATSTQSEPTSMAAGNSAMYTTGLQTEASTTTIMKEVHITTLPQTDTTRFIETNTKDTGISQTETTGAPTDIRLTTAAKEDATDKLLSSTSNESPVTTNSLKGNSNAAGTVLSDVSLLMISSAFILVSV